MKSLPETFADHIGICIGESGVYPHVMMTIDADDKLGVFALDLKPGQVYDNMLKVLLTEKPKELIFGMDRFCKDGQGTTLGDCIAGAYWNGEAWRTFMIEYQHDPRIVKPLDWDNAHWNNAIQGELTSFMDHAFGQKKAS